MAMNIGTLTAALRTRIDSELTAALSNYNNIADDENLSGFTFAEYLDRFSQALANAIADEVISHITTFARGNGVDSRGDTHDAMGII